MCIHEPYKATLITMIDNTVLNNNVGMELEQPELPIVLGTECNIFTRKYEEAWRMYNGMS